jgi:hypothetical protein
MEGVTLELHIVANLVARLRTPSTAEHYVAQAVGANDFQVRLLALERERP